MTRAINDETMELVRHFEGLGDGNKSKPGLQPYICPAGFWTVGYGRVVRDANGRMFKGEVDRVAANAVYPNGIDKAQAEAFLQEDLAAVGGKIARNIRVPLTDNEFGACVAFAFNVGVGAFASSTLLRRLNEGKKAEAADQFLVWDKATDPTTSKKVVLPGLSRRRQAERDLFLKL